MDSTVTDTVGQRTRSTNPVPTTARSTHHHGPIRRTPARPTGRRGPTLISQVQMRFARSKRVGLQF